MTNRRFFLKQLGLGAVSLGLATDALADYVPGCAQSGCAQSGCAQSGCAQSGCAQPGCAQPVRSGLPRSLPGLQGVNPGGILDFLTTVEAKKLNVHSLMVVRHGNVVAEGWWAPYAPDLKHTLYSLSKSFVSTAVGLAVAEKKLRVDDTVISFFPDDLPAVVSDNLAAMRVRDLLTMSTGHDQEPTKVMRANGNINWPRVFLAHPVDHQPGTHFVYNSGATYMLSNIVQQLTGQTVLDYLTPRLFRPLGIEGADWEVDPTGVNTGGWGLRVRTEDIAKFGQLYLQKGVWNGKQLLPEAWVADATQGQILQPAGDKDRDASDWLQGYGYQFWRCRHDAYRGDGAFGQYCVVLPDKDAVIAITSETANMPAVLNAVWDHILPALQPSSEAANNASPEPLTRKLTSLALPLPTNNVTSPKAKEVGGKLFRMEPNALNIDAASLTFNKDGCSFTFHDDRGSHRVLCGLNHWREGTTTISTMPLKLVNTPVPGETTVRVAGSGTWPDANTFLMTWRFIETAHYETVTCRFADDNTVQITFENSLAKIGHAKDARPVLQGKLRS